jgi:hypothetical protein
VSYFSDGALVALDFALEWLALPGVTLEDIDVGGFFWHRDPSRWAA